MNDEATAYAKRLEDKYEKEAPVPPPGVTVPEVFAYLHFKAFAFLAVGPDEYRLNDAFHFPPEDLPASRLDEIKRGCEQLVQFRGASAEHPLEDIGVDGFYALLRLFHFDHMGHKTLVTEQPGIVLDEMQMKHVVDSREITLYNKIALRRKNTGAPCPYCGEPLRTAFAKQCRHCGVDWHDPENVMRRKGSPP
jgi:hypothetical protein